MYKYRIGDRVIVRSDLITDDKDYFMEGSDLFNYINDDMAEYCGQIVTIKDYDSGQYLISETGYYWTDEMFEGLVEDASVDDFDIEVIRFLEDD